MEFINSFLWGPPMLIIYMFIGIYFTVGTKFFQIRHFGAIIKNTLCTLTKPHKKGANISPFQALSTALASCIGTGNIVGVATAIAAGGAGAVFWMWVSAFFGMMTNYAETVLGVHFRKTTKKGEYYGGPMYYMELGLGFKKLGLLFAFLCLFASFGVGNIAQINGVSAAFGRTFSLNGTAPKLIIGIIMAAVIGAVIFGGIKRIAAVTERLIPAAALLYIAAAAIVLIAMRKNIPTAFFEIIEGAFSLKSVAGGGAGFVAARAVRFGIARGVFTNEAGLGSSVLVHASADVKNPCIQGFWGIFQVFFDTIVMCTLTALVLITTNAHQSGLDGVEMSSVAFESVLGTSGKYIITFGILFFAVATIIGWSFYGVRCVSYISKGNSRAQNAYKAVYLCVTVVGAVSGVDIVWSMSDIFNGLMAIPNLLAVFMLSPIVFKLTKDYKAGLL